MLPGGEEPSRNGCGGDDRKTCRGAPVHVCYSVSHDRLWGVVRMPYRHVRADSEDLFALTSHHLVRFDLGAGQDDLDRNARLCGLDGRLAQRTKVWRSSSPRARVAFGQPDRAMRISIIT